MTKYISISIIKAFACLSVVIAHWKAVFMSMGSPRIDRLVFEGPLVLLIYSSMGVSIFLMLSAALAGLKLYRNPETDLTKECIRRYVRLSIPIFFTSLFVLILQNSGHMYTSQAGILLGNEWVRSLYPGPLRIVDLLRISFFTALFREENSFYVPFWMMSYIFLGSLVSMGLSRLMTGLSGKGRTAVFLFLILVMSILDSYYLCVVLGNLIGLLLAEAEKRNSPASGDRQTPAAGRRLVPAAAALMLFGMWFSTMVYKIAWNVNARGTGAPLNDAWFWQVISGFSICIGGICVFEYLAGKAAGCPGRGLMARILKALYGLMKAAAALGSISYEIFLTHWLVICSFSCWFYVRHADSHMHVSILMNFCLSFLLILALSFLYSRLITGKAAGRVYEALRSRLLAKRSGPNDPMEG